MKTSIFTITFLLSFLLTLEAAAQDRLPTRQYTNPEEIVVLTSDIAFQDALGIIEELSIEFADKILVNEGTYTGPIGIEVPQMHWEDALYRIAEANGMFVTEYPRYYQIEDVPEEEIEEGLTDAETEEEIRVEYDTREVKISATFFQGDRQLIRQMGIDWTAVRNGEVRVQTSSTIGVQQDVFDVDVNLGEIFEAGSWDINALFRAFEESGNGEILSSPSIKVMNGRQGNIQVGEDFSIKQRDFAGNITDEFFSTGTILTVTPRVFYNEEDQPFIYMTVEVERSTAQPDPVSTIVAKQEAATEVLMLSGESTVLAGLYETEVSSTRRGIPILKDLPPWFLGLRYLFGFNSNERTVQELVVLLKVELVPTLEERINQPFQDRPELLQEERNNTLEEIRRLQENIRSASEEGEVETDTPSNSAETEESEDE
jgi:type IV pilus assembly protein PilQ